MTSKLQVLWHKYIRKFGEDFCVENGKFKCNICDVFLNVTRRSQVEQHTKTKKHIDSVQLNPSNNRDNEDDEVVNELQVEFNSDLFNAFVKADIPLTKLGNDELKNFLLKYTNIELPSERTLRRMLLPEYQKALSDIRSHVGSKNIWISIDETCDIAGRSVVNVIVGVLDGLPDKKPILIHVEYTQPPNHSIIAQVFENALSKLWPDGKHYERVLLFVTDGASYMKKAAKALKIIYPKMLHITCIIHGLHRVCEKIRSLFQCVDNLITEGKRVFRKAPKRIQLLKQLNSNLPVPPQPTITRWGTWLEASVYYYNYFSEFKIIVNSLDSNEAASIARLKQILDEPLIISDLARHNNFSFIVDKSKFLQTRNLSIEDQLNSISEIKLKLSNLHGGSIADIIEKFETVINKNTDLKQIEKISKIVNTFEPMQSDEIEYDPVQLNSFKFAPLSSSDIERTFSQYKTILRPNRLSFTDENLKMYLIIHCNKQ